MSTFTCDPLIKRSHVSKSRSIGSLPPPHTLRLTPTIPIPRPPSVPPISMSSPLVSPTRLPTTESMSYFPPFETMGSGAEDNAEAGPSRLKEQLGHSKGRSLGSLAGLMSFLSPGTPPLRPSVSVLQEGEENIRSSSDGDVLQALAKRVTPGKRRVLEPITVSSNENLQVTGIKHQRRRTGGEIRAIRGRNESMDGDEMVKTPLRQRRRPRPPLVLTSLPQWRFPMPSPPVISLSSDIPLSAFSPIENPASNPSSTDSSPCKPLTPSALHQTHHPVFRDDSSPTTSHFNTLSSGSSRPRTPEDDWIMQSSPNSLKTVKSAGSFEPFKLYPRLERSVSQITCDSKETIKPSKEVFQVGSMDGEVTPKAGRC